MASARDMLKAIVVSSANSRGEASRISCIRRTTGMTWRLPVRLSAVSSCCAWLKSGTTPSRKAGTWSRTSTGELYSAPVTLTRPTRVSLT